MKLQDLEIMLAYNISKGASKKTIAQIRADIKKAKSAIPSTHIASVYLEDLHRGKGGGGSSEKANTASLKTLMKDNRIRETRYTRTQREMLIDETNNFREAYGLDSNFKAKETQICNREVCSPTLYRSKKNGRIFKRRTDCNIVQNQI